MTKPFRYLLDTSALSDLVRHPQGAVASRIAQAGEETICTSIIVAAEFRFGAEKSDSAKLTERVDLILSAIEILLLESPADREYAKLRHHLARNGTAIGPNDMLIAAQAPSSGLIVVTANTAEFSRIPHTEGHTLPGTMKRGSPRAMNGAASRALTIRLMLLSRCQAVPSKTMRTKMMYRRHLKSE